MTGKNILRGTLILLLLATLFPPIDKQSILDLSDRYFLLTIPYPAYFIAYIPLLFEYVMIIFIGLFIYTFKKG